MGSLDYNGAFSWGPLNGVPPGLSFWSVGVFFSGPALDFVSATPPNHYTIP